MSVEVMLGTEPPEWAAGPACVLSSACLSVPWLQRGLSCLAVPIQLSHVSISSLQALQGEVGLKDYGNVLQEHSRRLRWL